MDPPEKRFERLLIQLNGTTKTLKGATIEDLLYFLTQDPFHAERNDAAISTNDVISLEDPALKALAFWTLSVYSSAEEICSVLTKFEPTKKMLYFFNFWFTQGYNSFRFFSFLLISLLFFLIFFSFSFFAKLYLSFPFSLSFFI